MSSHKQREDRLARREFLQAGTGVFAGGLLGLLAPDGLFAWAETESRIQSMPDVNRRVRPLSCDTMVALPDATTTGTTVLGKNSDRPVFDSRRQVPGRVPRSPVNPRP